MITAGKSRGPALGVALGASAQVVGAQLVEAAEADAQFGGDSLGRKVPGAGLGQEMTDQRSGNTVGELELFIAPKIAGGMDLSLFLLMPAGASRAGLAADPTCRLSAFRRRSGCVPAEPYPPLKRQNLRAKKQAQQGKRAGEAHFSSFVRTALSSFVRTTTGFLWRILV